MGTFPSTRRGIWLLVCALLLACGPLGAQAGKSYTLGAVTVSGARRFSLEQLVLASGLKKGQQIDVPGIDAAADRLFKTGALASISYTYRLAGAVIDVQFKLSEASKFLPCTFENFVWFRDEELVAAVRQQIPLFDGSLPISGDLPATVPETLDRFLREHGIKGSVIATLSGKLGEQPTKYDLRVSEISIPVNSISIRGGLLTPEALAKATHVLSLSDYSRSVARGVGQSVLTETYEDEGYLQAKFSDPQVVMKDPQGHDASLGVTLTYDVIPGAQYHSSGVTWNGNQALSAADLSKLMEVQPGDVARRDKLTWSWIAVHDSYGKDGYLAANVEATPEFDAAQGQVHFQAKIAEGPQYRMGAFTATGVPDITANKLKAAWRLREGQIYDASYESTFQRADMPEVMRTSVTSRFTVTLHRKLDTKNHVVDVELEIK
jgi:outer membrane protein insertion porin family